MDDKVLGLPGGLFCAIASGSVMLVVFILFWLDGRTTERRVKAFFRSE